MEVLGDAAGAAWDGSALGQKRRPVEYCANATGAGTLNSAWHRIWASATANPALCSSLPGRHAPVGEVSMSRSAQCSAARYHMCSAHSKQPLLSHRHKPKMPAYRLQAIATHDDSHYRPESDVSARFLANIQIGGCSAHRRLHPQLALSMALHPSFVAEQNALKLLRDDRGPSAHVAPCLCRNTDCGDMLAMPSCTRKHLLSSYLACWGSSSADCVPPQPLFRWRWRWRTPPHPAATRHL